MKQLIKNTTLNVLTGETKDLWTDGKYLATFTYLPDKIYLTISQLSAIEEPRPPFVIPIWTKSRSFLPLNHVIFAHVPKEIIEYTKNYWDYLTLELKKALIKRML